MENSHVKFTKEQAIIKLGLNLDFPNLSSDDLILTEDTAGDRVTYIAEEWGKYSYEEKILYSILDYLATY
jgi:hypothetical protein